jgi:glycosyltransferase involved in cell wall biosynthesis
MKLTIVTCTYARVNALEELIHCFERVDFPCDLLVLNDCPRQILVCQSPNVTIINHPTRFQTMGEKRNFVMMAAKSNNVLTVDDDDIFTSYYPAECFRSYEENGTMPVYPVGYFSGNGKGKDFKASFKQGSVSGTFIIHKNDFVLAGMFPRINSGQDQAFLARIKEHLKPYDPMKPHNPPRPGYIYRWANGVDHLSGRGPDKILGDNWAKVEAAANARMDAGQEPEGEIILKPHWEIDYEKAACTTAGAPGISGR